MFSIIGNGNGSDSDTDADAVDNNIFSWKTNKYTYSAGLVTKSQNNKTSSTSNGKMVGVHGLPTNFERQQYIPHNYTMQRNTHDIRDTASVRSTYNSKCYPRNSQYDSRQRGYASVQLSPVSMRSASDAMSVCSRASAFDIVESALKTKSLSRQEADKIARAYQEYVRGSGKIRKRLFRRKNYKHGDEASNSSLSSEDDCRSQKSYRSYRSYRSQQLHDRYSRNRTYCPKRQANSTKSEFQFRPDNTLIGQAMKDKTICTDRTNTLKQNNMFSMRPWNRSSAVNGMSTKPLPIAEENFKNDLVVQDKIKSPEKIISCSQRINQSDVLGLPKLPHANSTLRNNTQKEKPKDFEFLKPTLPFNFKGRSKKSGVSEPVNNNINEEKEDDQQNNDQYEMSQCSSDTLTKSSFMRRKLFTQTLDVTENKLNKSTNLIPSSPLTNIYSSDTKGAKQKKSNITQPCLKRSIVEENNKSKHNNILELVQQIVPPQEIDTIKARTSKSTSNVPKIDVSARIANYDLSNLSDSFTDEENFFVVKPKPNTKKSAPSKNNLQQKPKPKDNVPKSKEDNVSVIRRDNMSQNISNINRAPILSQSRSILQNRKFQFDFSKNQYQILTPNKNKSSATKNMCSSISKKVKTFWDTDTSESELSHADNTIVQNDVILKNTYEPVSKPQAPSKKTVNVTPKASTKQTKLVKDIAPVNNKKPLRDEMMNNKKHFTRSSTGTSPDTNHENVAPVKKTQKVNKKPPKENKGESKKKTVIQKKNQENKMLSSTPMRTTRRSANITDSVLGRSPLISIKLDEVGDRSGTCQNNSDLIFNISVNSDSHTLSNNSRNSNTVTRSSARKVVAQHKSRECLHSDQDNDSRKDEKGKINVKKQTTVLVGHKHTASRRMSNLRNLSKINKVDKSAPKNKSRRRRSSIHKDGQGRQLNYWQRSMLVDEANKSFTFTRTTRNSLNSALDSTQEFLNRCNDDIPNKRKLYRNRNNYSHSESNNSSSKLIEKLVNNEFKKNITNIEASTRRSSKRKITCTSSNLPKISKTGPSPKSNTSCKTNNFEHAHTDKMIYKRYFTRSSLGDSLIN